MGLRLISSQCVKHEALTPHLSWRHQTPPARCPCPSRCCSASERLGLSARGASGLPTRPLPPDVVQAQLGPRRDPQLGHLTECKGCCGPLLVLRRRHCGQWKAPALHTGSGSALRPLSAAPPSGSMANPLGSREISSSVGII